MHTSGRHQLKREGFSAAFSLSDSPKSNNLWTLAREEEFTEIHRMLRGDGSHCGPRGLRGVGKTQLTIAYAKRHKEGQD
jgi:hypothetical protein